MASSSLNRYAVRLGLGAMAIAAAWYGASMTNAQVLNTDRHFPLRVAPGQTVSAFAALNKDVPAFQSPLHPVTGGLLIFHDTSQLVITGPRINTPLTLIARDNRGSAVVDLDTYDASRSKDQEERIKKISFRPFASNNSAEVTQELVRQFYGLLSSRKDCQIVKVDGDRVGKVLATDSSGNWPIEALKSALEDMKGSLYAAITSQCGGVKMTFEVIEPGALKDAQPENRGFDVSIYIESA